MTETFDFSSLQNRFNKIKEIYLPESLKYIHAKTVDNFLFHADSFFMRNNKEEIFKTLTEYFENIDTRRIDNTADSLELFNKFIKPLATLYVDLKSFHLASRIWVILFLTILFIICLYFLHATIYFYIGILMIVFFLIGRQLNYKRQRKTYGFMH